MFAKTPTYNRSKASRGSASATDSTPKKAIARSIAGMLANGGLTYDDAVKVPAPNVASSAKDFGSGKSDVLFFALGSAKK